MSTIAVNYISEESHVSLHKMQLPNEKAGHASMKNVTKQNLFFNSKKSSTII